MKSFFKANQTILLQGDSITDCHRNRDDHYDLGEGYPAKVAALYNALYPDTPVTFLNRGVSGDRTIDVLSRYDEDILAIKPDFVSVLLGINDVWRRYDENSPTSVEAFEEHYETLLKKIKSDFPNAPLLIIEPYLLTSDEAKQIWHEDLDPKRIVIRKIATKYADYFIPLDGIFATMICDKTHASSELSLDDVHPTDLGHSIIAKEWLKALNMI